MEERVVRPWPGTCSIEKQRSAMFFLDSKATRGDSGEDKESPCRRGCITDDSKCSFYRQSNAVQCPFHVSLFIRVPFAMKMSLTLAGCRRRRLGAHTLTQRKCKNA